VSDRLKLSLIIAVLTAVSLFSACYTLFKHPRLAQLDYQRPEDNRCLTCHSSQDLWSYANPPSMPPAAGPWNSFYNQPWWHKSRWAIDHAPIAADSTRHEGGGD
jgi:hypothetical protein